MVRLISYFCEDCKYFKKDQNKPCDGFCEKKNEMTWVGRIACENLEIKN